MIETKLKPEKKPIQVLLALSLLFQVKDKLIREDWMVAREIYSANPKIMTRIKTVIENDYGYEVKVEHVYQAIVMLLVGLKIDIKQRPMR